MEKSQGTGREEFARKVLSCPNKAFVLAALSLVNLGDEETEMLIYRYMRLHTQEDAASHFQCSVNHVYDVQKAALLKCWKVWHRTTLIKNMVEEG